jgi:pimeloyl-ACP methyl ester carboxylesterase
LNSTERVTEVPPDVVILVPGIRDHALWGPVLRAVLEKEGFAVELTNFDRFSVFAFLSPWDRQRRQAQDELSTQVERIREKYRGRRPHIIAHSFGTYLVGQLLLERPGPAWPVSPYRHQFGRIIFCGSVVPYNFPFEDHKSQFIGEILNEVGTRDYWPARARFLTWWYGAAGTFGFKREGVRDRWHKKARHNYFLHETFCQQYWVPILRGQPLIDADQPENLPYAIELLGGALRIYPIVAFALLFAILWFAIRRL